MKRVVAIVGSNSRKSNTAYFIRELLERLKEKSIEGIEYDIFTAYECKILQCQGCLNCFSNIDCIHDKIDDMDLIKRKVLEADLVIIGSPVYVHNVSGVMKNIIDRIAAWTHIMRLAGKYGLIITTTSNNGSNYVQDYLKSISSYLGLQLIGGYNISVDLPSELYDERKRNEIIEKCSIDIINAFKTQSRSTYLLEATFKSLKSRIEKAINIMPDGMNNKEVEYWRESGNINYDTFQKLLDSKK